MMLNSGNLLKKSMHVFATINSRYTTLVVTSSTAKKHKKFY